MTRTEEGRVSPPRVCTQERKPLSFVISTRCTPPFSGPIPVLTTTWGAADALGSQAGTCTTGHGGFWLEGLQPGPCPDAAAQVPTAESLLGEHLPTHASPSCISSVFLTTPQARFGWDCHSRWVTLAHPQPHILTVSGRASPLDSPQIHQVSLPLCLHALPHLTHFRAQHPSSDEVSLKSHPRSQVPPLCLHRLQSTAGRKLLCSHHRKERNFHFND